MEVQKVKLGCGSVMWAMIYSSLRKHKTTLLCTRVGEACDRCCATCECSYKRSQCMAAQILPMSVWLCCYCAGRDFTFISWLCIVVRYSHFCNIYTLTPLQLQYNYRAISIGGLHCGTGLWDQTQRKLHSSFRVTETTQEIYSFHLLSRLCEFLVATQLSFWFEFSQDCVM